MHPHLLAEAEASKRLQLTLEKPALMCGLFFERYSALLSIKKDVRLIPLVTEKRTRHQDTSPRVPGIGIYGHKMQSWS